MDRLAAHVVATAVLTAALAAVPTAMASPAPEPALSSTPTPTPMSTPTSVPTSSPSPSASLTVPVTTGQPKSSPAPTPSPVQPTPCVDARQVGKTVYARWHSLVAFSVKQFYSPTCHAVYGYAFPWLEFRLAKAHYDLGLAVYDVTHDAIDGARTFVGGAGGPDFWSSPVTVPARTCTEGLAHVFFPDTETDTYTAPYCG